MITIRCLYFVTTNKVWFGKVGYYDWHQPNVTSQAINFWFVPLLHMRFNRSRSLKVTQLLHKTKAHIGYYFLLVIICDISFISHHFRWQVRNHPTLERIKRMSGPPSNIVVKLTVLKDETFIHFSVIVASAFLSQYTRVTDTRQSHYGNSRTLQYNCNVRL